MASSSQDFPRSFPGFPAPLDRPIRRDRSDLRDGDLLAIAIGFSLAFSDGLPRYTGILNELEVAGSPARAWPVPCPTSCAGRPDVSAASRNSSGPHVRASGGTGPSPASWHRRVLRWMLGKVLFEILENLEVQPSSPPGDGRSRWRVLLYGMLPQLCRSLSPIRSTVGMRGAGLGHSGFHRRGRVGTADRAVDADVQFP